MTERISLYNEIHKGLRREMLTLLLDCSQIDPKDPAAVGAVATRFRALRSLLDEHAGHEERYVEPLLAEQRPDVAASLRDEHRGIDAQMVEVDAALGRWEEAATSAGIRHGQLAYGVLASFVGAYLQHMSREEDEAMPVLQAAMTDEQLLAVSNELRGAIPPARLAEFIAIMLPAMNVEERSQMFAGLKAEAPPEALDGMCALASRVLAPSDWTAVQTRVGLS